MPGCRRVRVLMAVAIYEPLEPDDQEALEIHLARCERCRAEYHAMRRLVGMVPRKPTPDPPPHFPALIRQRIDHSVEPNRISQRVTTWGAPVFAGAAALALGLALYTHQPLGLSPPTQDNPSGQARVAAPQDNGAPAGELPADDPMGQAIAQADTLEEQGDYMAALQVLQEAVNQHPDHELAGRAQLKLASLTFEDLHRYELAFKEYMKLRNQFGHVFRSDSESIERFELLVEEWENEFLALRTVDALEESGADAFDKLEQIVAQNPGQQIAQLALNKMQRIVREAAAADNGEVALLEAVRDQCTHPVARAQVNLYLGDKYCDELNDPGRARALYLEAAQGDHPVVASMADEALARLSAP
ncbi:MAG: hypothetical protein ACLFTT_01295 [Candidatus Hydrogenedentota bacterium]